MEYVLIFAAVFLVTRTVLHFTKRVWEQETASFDAAYAAVVKQRTHAEHVAEMEADIGIGKPWEHPHDKMEREAEAENERLELLDRPKWLAKKRREEELRERWLAEARCMSCDEPGIHTHWFNEKMEVIDGR